ncbi:MAG: hypothetical protein Alis3KO_27110 [Aliiglaciecola sp.]
MKWGLLTLVLLFLPALCEANTEQKSPQKLFFDLGQPAFFNPQENMNIVNYVKDIVQDEKGFLWVATVAGLFRYDGYVFKPMPFEQSDPSTLSGDGIESLVIHPNGNLWVGTDSAGLSIGKSGNHKYSRHLQNERVSGLTMPLTINAMHLADSKNVWLGTNNGLYLLDENGSKITIINSQSTSKMSSDAVTAIEVSDDGRVYFATKQEIVFFDDLDRINKIELDSEYSVSSMQQHQDTLWVGTTNRTLLAVDKEHTVIQALTGFDTHDFVFPSENEMWIGTQTQGIKVVDIQQLAITHTYTHDAVLDNALNADFVSTLMIDDAKQIWIGTGGDGLVRFDYTNKAVRNLDYHPSSENGISGVDPIQVFERSNGEIWVAPMGTGIDVFIPEQGKIRTYSKTNQAETGLTDFYTRKILQDANETIWVATHGGLFKHDRYSDTFTLYSTEHGLRDNYIHTAEIEESGAILLATAKGLNRFNAETNKAQPLLHTNGKRDDLKYIWVEKDHAGLAWATNKTNTFVVNPDSDTLQKVVFVDHYGETLKSMNITSFSPLTDGRFLIGSTLGLWEFKGWYNSTKKHAELRKLSDNPNVSGPIFKSGQYYFNAYEILKGEDFKLLNFTESDGRFNRISWDAGRHVLSEGTLVFGGNQGLNMVRPALYKEWNYQPQVALTELKLNGKAQDFENNNIIISPDIRSFSVEFSALDFTRHYPAEDENKYAYLLKGYNDNWTDVDPKKRTASFTNLSPGHYTLIVKGSNRAGKWSSHQLKVNISVLPDWYQTWWFRTLILLFALMLLYGLYTLRVRQMNNKRQELELLVAERTHLLEEKSQALAAQTVVLEDKSRSLENKTIETTKTLEKLMNTQDKLVESEKHASLGRLVVGVSHELNTPLSIARLAADQIIADASALNEMVSTGKISKSQLDNKNRSITDASSMINSSVDRAANLVERFKELSTEQTQATKQDIELGQHIQHIITALELGNPAMQGHIHLQIESQLHLNTEPEAFTKIIKTLFINAMQHAFTEDVKLARLDICIRKEKDVEGESIVLTFSDNGRGIDDKELPLIFDPFYTSSRNKGGVGLGLNMLFNIVTHTLGGTIACQSTLGHGTQFTIRIPLREQELSVRT